MGKLLKVRGLSAGAGDKPILHDIDLTVGDGEIHVLMGPNGAGKSTLGQVVMGDPEYTVSAGTIELAGEDITDKAVDYRSRAGLFMSFQAPIEVPGVPLNSFLRAIVAQHGELNLKGKRYKKRVAEIMERLDMDEKYLNRELNVGFSGGEKKKIEMLQLLLLQPKLAILDETDSGLDVDALSVVSRAIAVYRDTCAGSLLIITHQKRLLEHLDVDHTHVMVAGRLVETGGPELVDDINENGFERFIKAAPVPLVPAEEAQAQNAQPEQTFEQVDHFNAAEALAHMEAALAEADAAAKSIAESAANIASGAAEAAAGAAAGIASVLANAADQVKSNVAEQVGNQVKHPLSDLSGDDATGAPTSDAPATAGTAAPTPDATPAPASDAPAAANAPTSGNAPAPATADAPNAPASGTPTPNTPTPNEKADA